MLGGSGLSLRDTPSVRAYQKVSKKRSRFPSEPKSRFHRQTYERSVFMIIRWEYRSLLGMESYLLNGHFVDNHLTQMVHQYSNAVDYPNGHHTLKTKSSVMSAVISYDGRYLFTGMHSSQLSRWDLIQCERVNQWEVYPGWVKCMDINDRILATGGTDYNVRIWDANTNQELCKLKGHSDEVRKVRFIQGNSDSIRLVSCSDDRTLRIWSVSNGVCLTISKGHSDWITSLITLNNCEMILSGSEDKSLRLWESESGECVTNYSIHHRIRLILLSCDSALLACICQRSIIVYRWPEMFEVQIIHEQNQVCGAFHPSVPLLLALADSDDSLKLLDVSNGRCIHDFKDHSHGITDVCFTPDGLRLISVSRQRRIQLWDLSSILKSLD